jgi:hypothetical protein
LKVYFSLCPAQRLGKEFGVLIPRVFNVCKEE